MKNIPLTILMALVMTLTACGGGSSDSADNNTSTSSTTPPPETPLDTTDNLVIEETLPRIDIYNAEGEIPDEPKITANPRVTNYIIGETPII